MTSICLTFDFDAVSLWVSSMKQTTATPISRGEFGARVGVPRILALLEKKNIKATFFTPAHTAAAFTPVCEAILAGGHEIALHGYCHETPVGLPEGEEARLLDAAIAKLKKALGADFTPKGYRSPAWDLSTQSVSLLQERGLIYDSSMMADDYQPYFAPLGHSVDEHHFTQGAPSKVLELPVAWELDDFPHFSFLNRPMYLGMRRPSEVLEIWREEFDFCHSQKSGIFTLTMHPQIIGRGPRMAMLEQLIEHMQMQDGVSFKTCAQAASDYLSTLPAKDL